MGLLHEADNDDDDVLKIQQRDKARKKLSKTIHYYETIKLLM